MDAETTVIMKKLEMQLEAACLDVPLQHFSMYMNICCSCASCMCVIFAVWRQLAEEKGPASAETPNHAQAATAAMPLDLPALEAASDTEMMEVGDTLVLPEATQLLESTAAAVSTKPQEPVPQDPKSTAPAVATKPQEPVPQDSAAAAVATKLQEPVLQDSAAAVATKLQEPVPQDSAAAVAAKPQEPVLQDSAAAVATKPQEPVPQESTAQAVATKPQEPVLQELAAAVATKPQEPVPQETSKPAGCLLWTIPVASSQCQAWVRLVLRLCGGS